MSPYVDYVSNNMGRNIGQNQPGKSLELVQG